MRLSSVRTIDPAGIRKSEGPEPVLRAHRWARRRAGRRAGPPASPSPHLAVGSVIVGLFVVAAALAPYIAPYPSNAIVAADRLLPPSAQHLFGTDMLGRDMLSRILFGARIALAMGACGTGIAAVLGVCLGLAAGYYRGWVDQILSRIFDVWLAFPGLLLAIIIVARLGTGLENTVFALGIVSAPGFYRLTRAGTLSASRRCYVESARAAGASDHRIVWRHIAPNLASSLVVLATLHIGVVILAGGGLSFIGLGAQPPSPEWGAMLAAGREFMLGAPWLAVFPGLAITITVMGLNLLGDGLRDVMDPCRRR